MSFLGEHLKLQCLIPHIPLFLLWKAESQGQRSYEPEPLSVVALSPGALGMFVTAV